MEKANGTGSELVTTQEQQESGLATTENGELTEVDFENATMGCKIRQNIVEKLPIRERVELGNIVTDMVDRKSVGNFMNPKERGFGNDIINGLGVSVMAASMFWLTNTNFKPDQISKIGILATGASIVKSSIDKRMDEQEAFKLLEKHINRKAIEALVESNTGSERGEQVKQFIRNHRPPEIE